MPRANEPDGVPKSVPNLLASIRKEAARAASGGFSTMNSLGENMRHKTSAGLRSAVIVLGAVGTCSLGLASSAIAQQAVDLPELDVSGGSPSNASQSGGEDTSPAQPPPVAAAPQPLKVSGEVRIGTRTTDITSEDLARVNPADLQDVFMGQPGIVVGGAIPMTQKVYVHGIEETNLAVTIDGASQNHKVFHHNGTNFVDPSLLKAVRVDAGVAPADAGFGALAGSIAYETKDVVDLLEKDGVGGFAKTQFNTNGNVFTNNVAAYGMSRGFEILGYFNIADGDEFEAGNGDVVEGSETKVKNGIGKVAYQALSGDRFEVSHERFNDDAARPYRANFIMPPLGLEPRFRNYEINRQTTVFNYSDATPHGWWDPKVVVAHSKTEVETPFVNRRTGASSPVFGEAESYNGKVENKFAFDIGSVIAGIDFNNTMNALEYSGGYLREKSNVVGGYAQARLEPIDGTRVSFGGRFDHQDFTGVDGTSWTDSGASGNVSAEQDLLGEFLTAKAGYSHVWAGVLLEESFILDPSFNYGNGFDPAIADNYTAGLIARYNGWTLEGTVFRTEISDARVRMIQRDIESEGYEIALGYHWRDGFLRVAYANIDTSIDGQPSDGYTGNYLTMPIGELITITGVHAFAGTGFRVGADAIIAPSYDRVLPGYDTYPSYKVFNAFVEYKPETAFDLTLRADVRNIFDEHYADRATYGQEFMSSDDITPLYEPGRSFIFSAMARF